MHIRIRAKKYFLGLEKRVIGPWILISTLVFHMINTIEDEEDIQLQLSNAMFAYAELPLCNCRRCRTIWAKTARKESGPPLATTNLHPPS